MSGSPRRSRRAGRHTNLMNAADLRAVWENRRCRHAESTMTVNGLSATLSCQDCDASLSFTLKFGRPKTFEVTINDSTVRPVGRASAQGVRNLLRGTTANLFLPNTENSEQDSATAYMMMEELTDGVQVGQSPKADFVGPWRDIDCDHKSASCRLYGRQITLECTDCATKLVFGYTGKDAFHVSMIRLPFPGTEYGWHGADTVLAVIREFAHTMEIPSMMADKMSHDPDRDARRIAALVSLLERRGVLRRINADPDDYDAMVRRLSAMLNTRREFVLSAKSLIAELGSACLQFNEDGRRIGARQGLETMWLTWPCRFEGVGLDVDIYNPVGGYQYCVRCGFSTLDSNTDNERWWRGCPECGYPGYLLGVGGGTGRA